MHSVGQRHLPPDREIPAERGLHAGETSHLEPGRRRGQTQARHLLQPNDVREQVRINYSYCFRKCRYYYDYFY